MDSPASTHPPTPFPLGRGLLVFMQQNTSRLGAMCFAAKRIFVGRVSAVFCCEGDLQVNRLEVTTLGRLNVQTFQGSTWHLVPGTRYSVLGTRYSVLGTRYSQGSN